MVDIENYVVNYVQTKYSEEGITVLVDSVFQPFPKEFPCVMVRETQNAPLDRTYDQSLKEHFARVIYQVDVIVAEAPIKANCKKLAKIADEAMTSLKFTRMSMDISTSDDRTMAWGTLRYRAIVGEPREEDGNAIFQMYR